MARNRSAALLGSALLHALVLGAGLIALPFASKPLDLPNSVPVTIVSRAPPETPTADVAAPQPTPATTPAPSPEPAPAPPPPPAPMPRPAPPQPKPAPEPPAPAPPVPAPRVPAPPVSAPKPAPTPAKTPDAKPLDLGALAASLPQTKAKPAKTPPKSLDLAALAASLPKASGAKGPSKAAAAPVVNPGPPRPLSGDEMGALQAKLIRLWNPNCGVEGAAKVVVRVEFHLSPEGRLIGQPQILDRPLVEAGGAVMTASAQRAVTAVVRGEPYSELPRDRYGAWKDVIVRFNAREACAGQ